MGMNALEVRRRVMLAQPHEAVASGAVASFRTDVVSALPMEFDLNPIQDLHGQANPYPPGGGKNLLGATLSDCKTINTNGTWSGNAYTINGVTFTVYEYDGYIERIATSGTALSTAVIVVGGIELTSGVQYKINGCPSGGSNTKYELMLMAKAQQGSMGLAAHDYGSGANYTETEATERGLQAVIRSGQNSSGLVFYPMIRLSSVSDGTFAPYSNICPITGHDGFTRTGTGKNLVDLSVIANQGSNVTEIENGYAFTSAGTQYSTGIAFSPPLTGVYTLSAKCKNGTGTNFRLRIHYSDGTNDDSNGTGTEEGFVTTTKTSNSTKSINSIRFNWASGGTFEVKELQLEQGTVATAYQPFGHSYSTTFPTPPGTVYGGHVRDNGDGTGTLVVNTAIYTFDGTNNAVNAMSDMGTYKFFSKTNFVVPAPNTTVSNDPPTLWCDTFKAKGGGGLGTAYISGSYFRICADSSFASVEAFNTWLQSNNVTFIYKLNSPVTYTLSLDAIQSLIGQNHIWVDNADSVTVEYWGH